MKHCPFNLRQLSLLLALSLTLFACGEEGGGGGLVDVDAGDFNVTPGELNFPQVEIGSSMVDSVYIRNNGRSTIRLWDLQLAEMSTRDGTAFRIANPWSGTHRLAPDDEIRLDIEYSPTDSVRYGAILTFQTNVADQETITVDINASTPRPEIFTPETVTFSRIPEGTSDWRLLEVRNIGYAPLRISNVSLDHGDDFGLSYPVSLPASEQTGDGPGIRPIEYDTANPPNQVAPNGSFYVRVRYTATDDQFRGDRIRIDSNDPTNPVALVAVTANSNAPCLEVLTNPIDFGLASIGRNTPTTVSVRNCSEVTETVITGIELSDDGDGVFRVVESSLPGRLAEGNNAVLGPRQTVNFFVEYAPTAEQVDEGELTIRSNDVANPVQRVPVVGQGSEFDCPLADARARIQGSSQWQNESINAIPLDVVEFNAGESIDPNGTNLTYEWTVLSRPQGSGAHFVPSATSSTPQMMLDIAGRYTVELNVFNEHGLAACERARLELTAAPNADIHIELTWEVPSSPSLTGTDLDLHYIHPTGKFGGGGLYEIYYAHRGSPENPINWGNDGTVSLDWDDLTGAEPENLNHNNPGGTVGDVRTYSAGVYYFADHPGWGTTVATVRIYLGGTLVRERSRHLTKAGGGPGGAGTRNGDFWWVADIPWDGVNLDVVDVDQIYSGFNAIPQ